MSPDAPSPEQLAKARRDKLLGRLMILALALLVLAYAIPTVMSARK
jgi:hypothetical protein